jgi:hypothetical protein
MSELFSCQSLDDFYGLVTGHWFTDTILWIPVTFGLFIFAFSSALFTAYQYGTEVNQKTFWIKKAKRLGVRFVFISFFLSLLLLATGGTVFHWHSLLHFTGLSGLLNWLQIPNQSSLGAGLWFFTLLLLFYLTYPYIAKLSASRQAASLVGLVATLGALYLELNIKVGHELWLTILGFIMGVTTGLHSVKLNAIYPFIVLVTGCVLLLALNTVFSYNALNTVLIFSTSISAAIWLTNVELPEVVFSFGVQKLEKCLLEIYLIHTYLFIHLTGVAALDFLLSFMLILITALVLNRLIKPLEQLIFR